MAREQVFVHHKNPYSLPGFKRETCGLVLWTTRPVGYYLYYNYKNLCFVTRFVKFYAMVELTFGMKKWRCHTPFMETSGSDSMMKRLSGIKWGLYIICFTFYLHSYILTIYPRRGNRNSNFLRGFQILPKWFSCEKYCRRDRW
jgi:hypothetical protein